MCERHLLQRPFFHLLVLFFCLTVFVLVGAPSWAMFKGAPDVSVERLLNNTASYIKEHPKDPQGYYVHARLHSLAYAMKRKTLPVFEREAQKQLPVIDTHSLSRSKQEEAKPSAEELAKHLHAALEHFRMALELDPENALFHLGFAYTIENGAADTTEAPPGVKLVEPSADERKEIEALVVALGDEDYEARAKAYRQLRRKGACALPALLKAEVLQNIDVEIRTRVKALIADSWRRCAMTEYLTAFRQAFKQDGKLEYLPIRGLSDLVSHEAGVAYLRLLKECDDDSEHKAVAAEVDNGLAVLRKLNEGSITPIIFSLSARNPAALSDLTAPDRVVTFDLDGDEAQERWSWVRPDTCILAWDPRGGGSITSGRQLFGSVTWWVFWKNGYHALDALDDNRDGVLTGDELMGLAVWRDRNSNGISDAGEVAPVEALGITGISVRVTHYDGEAPASHDGIRMNDGATRPSYDWIAESRGESSR